MSTKEDSSPKPCPFCGETTKLTVEALIMPEQSKIPIYVQCRTCGAAGPLVPPPLGDVFAICWWNKAQRPGRN